MDRMELELAGVLALGVSITFFGGLLFVNAIEYIGLGVGGQDLSQAQLCLPSSRPYQSC